MCFPALLSNWTAANSFVSSALMFAALLVGSVSASVVVLSLRLVFPLCNLSRLLHFPRADLQSCRRGLFLRLLHSTSFDLLNRANEDEMNDVRTRKQPAMRSIKNLFDLLLAERGAIHFSTCICFYRYLCRPYWRHGSRAGRVWLPNPFDRLQQITSISAKRQTTERRIGTSSPSTGARPSRRRHGTGRRTAVGGLDVTLDELAGHVVSLFGRSFVGISAQTAEHVGLNEMDGVVALLQLPLDALRVPVEWRQQQRNDEDSEDCQPTVVDATNK